MNLSLAVPLLFAAAAATTGAMLLTEDDLTSINYLALDKAADIQNINDKQTIEAAQIGYFMSSGIWTDSEDELVKAGYLKESFLSREKVPADK